MGEFGTVIGLEIHIELSTSTKMFCGCEVGFSGAPNTRVCPVCLGLPGALPVPNSQAVEYAVALGLAMNCDINRDTRFDRKNYFYPDNPQNYQISQLYSPICRDGYVDIFKEDNSVKKVRIHDIHMEEDAGKLIHDKDKTYIDLNRAGVPLLEIVTEPDMCDADEVICFLNKLRDTVRYLDISDCKMNEGSMRVDVNLSVGENGTRTEMKNLNSFRSIRLAIASESARQTEVVKAGKTVVQETRRWDDDTEDSYTMRTKEDTADYMYFPEPDIPGIHITEELIERMKSLQPEFREDKIKRYTAEYGLSQYDAKVITEYKNISGIFENTIGKGAPPKKVANYLTGETMRLVKTTKTDPEKVDIDPEGLCDIINLASENKINSSVAKDIFGKLFSETGFDVAKYVADNDLLQIADESELEKVISEVIEDNPEAVSDYRAGKTKAIGFLVGQVMKTMGGKADPQKVREVLQREL